jgi:tyrosine-protein phosphatase YwqE
MLYELTCQGYIPIIAHPERYSYFQEDYRLVDSFKEEGILFQCNYASILGYYGKGAEKLIKYMLKKEYVDYFGTDLHRIEKTFMLDNFKKIEKNIIKITGKEYYHEILNNCNQIINK